MHVAIPTNIQILHSVGMAPPIITYFKMCNDFSCYSFRNPAVQPQEMARGLNEYKQLKATIYVAKLRCLSDKFFSAQLICAFI